MNEYTQPIPETSYLSVPGVVHYRTIMRKMFLENEHMHYGLYKEEIFRLVHKEEGFESYTVEDLRQDLDQLVSWNNLIAVQDPGIVHTIAEYKNRQYRYSMSDRAVEVERLTVRLENLDMESSNLSANYFVRIENALKEADTLSVQSLQDIHEWWHILQEDFRSLNQNYKDYLRDFYTSDTRALMQSVEFVLHKDRFIQYLNHFIKQMQMHSKKIRQELQRLHPVFEKEILQKVVESESTSVPHALRKEQEPETISERIRNQWGSFERWFIPADGQKAECDQILEITNDIIRSIIENANMIVQLNNYGVSRKEDYRHFIEMFLNCASLQDAHCLCAHVFGVQQIEHLRLLGNLEEEDIRSGAFEKQEHLMEIESHSRTYRERRKRDGVTDHFMDKMASRLQYEEEMRNREVLVNRYIQDHVLDVAHLQGLIPSALRTTILSWIAAGNMSSEKTGNTESGRRFRIHKEEGTCVIHCEDGDLTMPHYILEFDI